MALTYTPGWLTWVSSVTSALRALDVACDKVDVAGYSGYAFALTICKGLSPAGPTFVSWPLLGQGILHLGRSVEMFVSGDCHAGDLVCDRTTAHCEMVRQLAHRELAAGRPCVVWGLGMPEFGVVRGIEGDDYLCVPGGTIPERVRWDQLKAPGGPAAFAFPTPVKPKTHPDAYALARGLSILTHPSWRQDSRCGLDAYTYWQQQLKARAAVAWSNAYNAQCWAEARKLAAEFLGRMVHHHGIARDHLAQAHDAMVEVARHLDAVASLYPFTMKFEKDPLTNTDLIADGCRHLTAAAVAEAKVIEPLRQAIMTL